MTDDLRNWLIDIEAERTAIQELAESSAEHNAREEKERIRKGINRLFGDYRNTEDRIHAYYKEKEKQAMPHSSTATETFHLPWRQGPAPDTLSEEDAEDAPGIYGPRGARRSAINKTDQAKRIYCYTDTGFGTMSRTFVAQTDNPEVAAYIVDACNAYAHVPDAIENATPNLMAATVKGMERQVTKLREQLDLAAHQRAERDRALEKAETAMAALRLERENMRKQLDELKAEKRARLDAQAGEIKQTGTDSNRRIRLRKGNRHGNDQDATA